MSKITILGAGLAGLSCSYHLGHENCIVFERNSYFGGHIFSYQKDGFTWDEGPHVSFTKDSYVRNLFDESVKGQLLEYKSEVSNFYRGAWIPHPAQSNLFAIPEPLRSYCLRDFLSKRRLTLQNKTPENYAEWLSQAFGESFADAFPAVYTRKYWTRDPKDLATDWIGQRVFFPDQDTVIKGAAAPAEKHTHYIDTVRYPRHGGYMGFASSLGVGANIQLQHNVTSIDLNNKIVRFGNGKEHHYSRLISTLPLPMLIQLAANVPQYVKEAAEMLACTSLLLVNVTADHLVRHPYHWLYVYDEDKFSTRINHTELLSPNNAPNGKTGVQVEVYGSRYRPLPRDHAWVAEKVVGELREMGLIGEPETVHTKYVPYANVIFDLNRRAAQGVVLNWLEQFGLNREEDDLEPTTDWKNKKKIRIGDLTLAGRFGQWKYFWTDDCVLRGKCLR